MEQHRDFHWKTGDCHAECLPCSWQMGNRGAPVRGPVLERGPVQHTYNLPAWGVPPPPKQSVYWAPIFLLHILLSAKIIIQIETNIIHCLVSLRMKYFRAIQFILDWQRKKWSKFENKFIFCLCPTHSIFCILFKWTVITSSRNVSRWLRRLSTAPWLSTRRPWKTCSLHRLNHIICSTCVISLELFKVSVCQDLKPQSQQQP